MIPETLWSEVKSILENDTTLKTYIKKIYEGIMHPFLDEFPKGDFPCIIMEPQENPEDGSTYPVLDCFFVIQLKVFIRVYDYEKQITGDATQKGVLDVELDIKKALSAYPDLNDKCIQVLFPVTKYENAGFPYRMVEIHLRIQYRQNAHTRE